MAFIIGLGIFGFLYIPLLLIVLAIKGHNAKIKEQRRRRQNIEDMKAAYTAAITDQVPKA